MNTDIHVRLINFVYLYSFLQNIYSNLTLLIVPSYKIRRTNQEPDLPRPGGWECLSGGSKPGAG